MSSVTEVHHALRALAIWYPCWQLVCGVRAYVRVTVLDEIYPIPEDHPREPLFPGVSRPWFRAGCHPAFSETESVAHLCGVGGEKFPSGIPVAAEEIGFRLVEEEHVDFSLALAGFCPSALQVGPGICRPGESRIAEYVAVGIESLLLIRSGIHLAELLLPDRIRERGDHLPFVLIRSVSPEKSGEHGSFIGVGAYHHIHVIIVPLLILDISIGGEHMVIVAWP